MILILVLVLVALGVFYGILQLSVPGYLQFILVVAEMLIVSHILIKKYKLPTEMGMVLLKSQKGMEAIEKLAKKDEIFKFFADVGIAMSYGLLSTVLMKKNSSIKTLIIGLLLLGFVSFLVGPTAFIFLFEILKVGSFSKGAMPAVSVDYGIYIVSAILLLGGLWLFILSGIVYYGAVIFTKLVETIAFGSDALAKTTPGGTFLLPGINLPLFEGILALAIVLVVHEGAHAVLARIAKIKILSSGIVLFGVIPVGAFVEPDEKELDKLDQHKHTRVIGAGTTSNLMFSSIFFILFFGLAILINNFSLFTTALAGPLKFIYITLGLTFSLNFIVGAVNLLPIPLFDGYRLLDINIKNKMLVKAVMYGTLFFFVLNFLPWFFQK
ncbi:site-2 protease family protein [Candidatus Micrarchaeota archaeon]|nr:site-2 protease family protein [Candidatus Micrarchaeota archaeon]